MEEQFRAHAFVAALEAIRSDDRVAEVSRFFAGGDEAPDNRILGVSIGRIFPVAKRFRPMSPEQIEVLLDSPYYEVRMGAVSIMDFQARLKSTDHERRQTLYTLYINRHDRINNWDLVDRAAPHVVGGWLVDKSRESLYKLAQSDNRWARRTAIVSTWYFIRANDLEDTFAIAGILARDPDVYVQKAVGSWLREAGKRDESRLLAFLDQYADVMPRPALRLAVAKLAPTLRGGLDSNLLRTREAGNGA